VTGATRHPAYEVRWRASIAFVALVVFTVAGSHVAASGSPFVQTWFGGGFGTAIAATLTQVAGLPWWVSLWIVTGLAISIVVALVLRARASGRRAANPETVH